MAFAITTDGERCRFSAPCISIPFQLARCAAPESHELHPEGNLDRVIVTDELSGDWIKFSDEDAELLERSGRTVKAGEIPAQVLGDKLIWFFPRGLPARIGLDLQDAPAPCARLLETGQRGFVPACHPRRFAKSG